MFSDSDHRWMQRAMVLADIAASYQEVPVGAVLVYQDNIIGEGWNKPISTNDPTAHAEIIALRAAAQTIQNYRLIDTTLYVTLEPCAMCVGAIVHARVKRVVFGAHDTKSEKCNHNVQYDGGLLAESCGKLLSEFFKAKRIRLIKRNV